MVVEQGEIRDAHGRHLHVAPDYDRDVEADIADWFEKYYSIQFATTRSREGGGRIYPGDLMHG